MKILDVYCGSRMMWENREGLNSCCHVGHMRHLQHHIYKGSLLMVILKELRRKEERIMAGAREEEGITLKEYMRQAGIKSLAEMIGRKI